MEDGKTNIYNSSAYGNDDKFGLVDLDVLVIISKPYQNR